MGGSFSSRYVGQATNEDQPVPDTTVTEAQAHSSSAAARPKAPMTERPVALLPSKRRSAPIPAVFSDMAEGLKAAHDSLRNFRRTQQDVAESVVTSREILAASHELLNRLSAILDKPAARLR